MTCSEAGRHAFGAIRSIVLITIKCTLRRPGLVYRRWPCVNAHILQKVPTALLCDKLSPHTARGAPRGSGQCTVRNTCMIPSSRIWQVRPDERSRSLGPTFGAHDQSAGEVKFPLTLLLAICVVVKVFWCSGLVLG